MGIRKHSRNQETTSTPHGHHQTLSSTLIGPHCALVASEKASVLQVKWLALDFPARGSGAGRGGSGWGAACATQRSELLWVFQRLVSVRRTFSYPRCNEPPIKPPCRARAARAPFPPA